MESEVPQRARRRPGVHPLAAVLHPFELAPRRSCLEPEGREIPPVPELPTTGHLVVRRQTVHREGDRRCSARGYRNVLGVPVAHAAIGRHSRELDTMAAGREAGKRDAAVGRDRLATRPINRDRISLAGRRAVGSRRYRQIAGRRRRRRRRVEGEHTGQPRGGHQAEVPRPSWIDRAGIALHGEIRIVLGVGLHKQVRHRREVGKALRSRREAHHVVRHCYGIGERTSVDRDRPGIGDRGPHAHARGRALRAQRLR